MFSLGSLVALAFAGCGKPGPSSALPSPIGGNINSALRVSPTSPLYFTDTTGKAIYLTGSWGHADLQSNFNFNAYLNWLFAEGHNFIRGYHEEEIAPYPYAPAPSDPSKVDLTQFNASFFTTLHAEALAAQNAGIYFSMMLFNGWSVNTPNCPAGADPTYNGWATNPYNAVNNMNGIDGDPNNTGCGTAIHTLNDPNITLLEDAYAVHLVTVMNDLNNLIWEICNECANDSTAFQQHYIALIRSTEAGLPKQHPTWFSVEWPAGSNADLFSSAADVVAPNDSSGDYLGENSGPNAATPPPIVMPDTDHLAPPCTLTPDWVWRLFTRGMGGIVQIDTDLDETPNPADSSSACGPENQAMAQARALADQSNLIALTPQGGLSSTGYCLANSGQEYIVYDPSGGMVNVDLSGDSDTFSATWLNTSTGETQLGGTVSGGNIVTPSPPTSFNDAPAVLHLVKQ
jgi:hypothetical protein